ncbi:hypothetical protein GYB59_18985 [bacterium]|nr:hypothetical protein [bacterium]
MQISDDDLLTWFVAKNGKAVLLHRKSGNTYIATRSDGSGYKVDDDGETWSEADEWALVKRFVGPNHIPFPEDWPTPPPLAEYCEFQEAGRYRWDDGSTVVAVSIVHGGATVVYESGKVDLLYPPRWKAVEFLEPLVDILNRKPAVLVSPLEWTYHQIDQEWIAASKTMTADERHLWYRISTAPSGLFSVYESDDELGEDFTPEFETLLAAKAFCQELEESHAKDAAEECPF